VHLIIQARLLFRASVSLIVSSLLLREFTDGIKPAWEAMFRAPLAMLKSFISNPPANHAALTLLTCCNLPVRES